MKSKHRKKIEARLIQIQKLFEDKERTRNLFLRIGKPEGGKWLGSELHNLLEAFYTLLETDIPDLLKEINDAFLEPSRDLPQSSSEKNESFEETTY